MHLPAHLRRTGAALTLTLAAGAAATGQAVAAPYDGGLSQPREDSYYPGKGDPGVDVLHYGLDLTWQRGRRTLVGDAVLHLRATADASRIRLDLAGGMRVRKVVVDGTPAAFRHTGKNLRVLVPVLADSRHRLRVTYRGTPTPTSAPTTRSDIGTVGMSVTSDGQLRTMQEPFGAFTWYPVNDQPSDKALYDIRVSAPGRWVGISNGTLVSRRRSNGRTTTSWHLADPAASYLLTLAVGPYAHRTATGPHGLPLHFWMPRGSVARYMSVFRHTASDLRWLERKLGRYPFDSAGAVVVPGDSAMETQTLVTFGRRAFSGDARAVMVHELAHQWYGDTVTPDDWSDLWLNEGMAMYLQATWDSEVNGLPFAFWVQAFSWSNVNDRPRDGAPAAYVRARFAETCVYFCTALMYHRLRSRLGEDTFWRLVRRWPQTHLNSSADRAEFVDWVEARSGRELSGFFDDWLLSPVWPPAG